MDEISCHFANSCKYKIIESHYSTSDFVGKKTFPLEDLKCSRNQKLHLKNLVK